MFILATSLIPGGKRPFEWFQVKFPAPLDPAEAARLQQIARGTAHDLGPRKQLAFFEAALNGEHLRGGGGSSVPSSAAQRAALVSSAL